MLTEREIVEETCGYYSEDTNRRAVIDVRNSATSTFETRTVCQYRTDDGRKCAIGRMLNEDGIEKFGYAEGGVDDICQDDFSLFKKLYLKPEYRNLTLKLALELQELHDGEQYWTDYGLSTFGRDKVEDILDMIG